MPPTTCQCVIQKIPEVCNVISCSGGVPEYALLKLSIRLNGLANNNSALDYYNYNASDVNTVWSATINNVSNGSIVSVAGVVSSNVSNVCLDHIDTRAEEYDAIEWYTAATTIGGSRHWIDEYPVPDEALMSCCIPVASGSTSADVSYTPTQIPGRVPGPAAPTTFGKNAAIIAPGAQARPGGGGPAGSSGDECDFFIGVITSAPACGFGPATVKRAIFNADGSYTTYGPDVNVIIPYV